MKALKRYVAKHQTTRPRTERRLPVRPMALTAVAVAGSVLLGLVGGYLGRAGTQHIPATEDGFALTSAARSLGPLPTDGLVAGADRGGAAISFVKFRVRSLPGGRLPARAEVRLARVGEAPLPGYVELTRVPSNRWRPDSLGRGATPRLGRVISTARPEPADRAVVFDVTKEIRAAGTYSFAVTVPAGEGLAWFAGSDFAPDPTRRPVLWLSWQSGRPPAPAATPATPTMPTLPTLPALPSLPPMPSLPTLPTVPPVSTPPTRPADATALPEPTTPPATPPTGPPTDLPTPTLPTPSAATSPPTAPTSPPTAPTSSPTASTSPEPPDPPCAVDERLVPTCGVLWGVAPAAHTDKPRYRALRAFERKTGRHQAIYHAYHRGSELFPTATEAALAREPGRPRLLFLNWKPREASWAEIAAGQMDDYLDRLAAHITHAFPQPFFLTIHHEPENDVVETSGSGYTAEDYAAMFRHVVQRLRARGATNIVPTMVYMAYVPWNVKPWFERLYPGDDVVDWVAWDVYAYSDPGHGHGDFAELMNRRTEDEPQWPGFYNWAAERFPDKPLMLGEWGVWHSAANPEHPSRFFDTVGEQIQLFPRVKAMVYFDTPADQRGRNSQVDTTPDTLRSYQRLGQLPTFDVSPGSDIE